MLALEISREVSKIINRSLAKVTKYLQEFTPTGKMKDALIGGLEYTVNLLQEAHKTKFTKLRIMRRWGWEQLGFMWRLRGCVSNHQV